MNITKITIVENYGEKDTVHLHTDFPNPDPLREPKPLIVSFSVKKGSGPSYVRGHFGMEPEITQSRLEIR